MAGWAGSLQCTAACREEICTVSASDARRGDTKVNARLAEWLGIIGILNRRLRLARWQMESLSGKRNGSSGTSENHPPPDPLPPPCLSTHTQAGTRTHLIISPSPSVFLSRLAGGDLPPPGFPRCLINYPSPIVYQEAREALKWPLSGGRIDFPDREGERHQRCEEARLEAGQEERGGRSS